ncbi:galactose oxidase/kelch repeat superfamily protein [Striga asiatica]|uniref:Galactose oxidase/kelch repeat superfamily protein n=1 Tax=Striga asiatica TaxID=4170 RepID=A0A5A7Q0H3_STRAF|nr:galactose oxidase/kelch repeat superfamily protein [Striga asiatica]
MSVAKIPLLRLPSIPLERSLLLRPKQTIPLKLPRHCIMGPPPSRVGLVTCKLPKNLHIPITIEVPKAHPWLEAQIVKHVENGRVGPKHAGSSPSQKFLRKFMRFGIRCHHPWSPPLYESIESMWSIRSLKVHSEGSTSMTPELKSEIDVAEDEEISINEDDLVVVGELPKAEFAIVPLIVGFGLSFWVADTEYGPDLPARRLEARAVVRCNGIINKDNEVAR